MEFLDIPNTYYIELKKRLASSKVQVKEDLEKLQKLKILIDYDDEGYLLQVKKELFINDHVLMTILYIPSPNAVTKFIDNLIMLHRFKSACHFIF
jgi:hypothetical protein